MVEKSMLDSFLPGVPAVWPTVAGEVVVVMSPSLPYSATIVNPIFEIFWDMA